MRKQFFYETLVGSKWSVKNNLTLNLTSKTKNLSICHVDIDNFINISYMDSQTCTWANVKNVCISNESKKIILTPVSKTYASRPRKPIYPIPNQLRPFATPDLYPGDKISKN